MRKHGLKTNWEDGEVMSITSQGGAGHTPVTFAHIFQMTRIWSSACRLGRNLRGKQDYSMKEIEIDGFSDRPRIQCFSLKRGFCFGNFHKVTCVWSRNQLVLNNFIY